MSMSSQVQAFRVSDDQYKKMKAVWDACQAGGITVPEDVEEFFGYEDPTGESELMLVSIGNAASEYRSHEEEAIDVYLSLLPQGVKILRFTNSW